MVRRGRGNGVGAHPGWGRRGGPRVGCSRRCKAGASGIRQGSRHMRSAVPTGSTAGARGRRAVVTRCLAERAPRPNRTHGPGGAARRTRNGTGFGAARRVRDRRHDGSRPSSWRGGEPFAAADGRRADGTSARRPGRPLLNSMFDRRRVHRIADPEIDNAVFGRYDRVGAILAADSGAVYTRDQFGLTALHGAPATVGARHVWRDTPSTSVYRFKPYDRSARHRLPVFSSGSNFLPVGMSSTNR